MGGGGGTTQSFTSNSPIWTEESHRRLIGAAEDLGYGSNYSPYGAPRIAKFSGDERTAQNATGQMFDRGDPWSDYGASQMVQADQMFSGVQPTQFGYGPKTFGFGQFDPRTQGRYMNQYQPVVNQQIRAATDEYERQNNRTAAQNIASGSRGGYREALQQSIAGDSQARTIAEIQQRGSLGALGYAQETFRADQQAAMEAARMGDASALQAAQGRMQAHIESQNRQQRSIDQRGQLAQGASALGDAGQTRALSRIQALEQMGVKQRDMEQASLNLRYEDYQRQEEYPWLQMQNISSILTGVPLGLTQSTRNPAPNTMAQILGAGVGAAGLSKILQ